MPQPGLWGTLAHLLTALSAGTTTLSLCGVAHCYLLCITTCLPEQHCMTGSHRHCLIAFYYLDIRTALQPGPTGTCNSRPGPTESKDCQRHVPRQGPILQHMGYVFCLVGYFINRGLGCQPYPTALNQCRQCPEGQFCPSRSTLSILCQLSTFSPHPGQDEATDCVPCPAGRACTQAGLTQLNAGCTPGYMCPASCSSPHAPAHACPSGTFSNCNNLSALSQCETCPAGLACPPRTKWGTQFLCPVEAYSPQEGNSQMEDCLPCPPGTFCPSGAPTPVLCPWGTSCQNPCVKLAVTCVLCPAGHHCPKLGTTILWPYGSGSFTGPSHLWCQERPGGKQCNQTKLSGLTACPPGHYCPAQGLLSIPCPMGTFREVPGASRVEDCQLCHPGTFCGREGLTEPQGLCRAGHYCGHGSNTSSPEGLPFGDLCPPGHFCPAGTEDPRQRPCPVGTWNPERGALDMSWCLPCPPGLFCATMGQAVPRGRCAPGYYCPGGAWTPRPLGRPLGDARAEGHACPEGSVLVMPLPDVQHHNGSGAEVTHADGRMCATAGGPCPPGHFCPVGTAMPHPCPVGTFSDRMLLSVASECLACPSGHFCGASGLTAPSGPCSPGYFCLAGVTSPTPTGHLEQGGLCPQGHFCPRGTSFPQPCPAGSYNNLTGQAYCFPCPAGYYCPETVTTYSGHPCPSGFYCPKGTKYATQFPCPRGYYNPDPLTQSLDGCLPCPPGHYCGQENLTQVSGPCDAGWFCVSAAWTPRPFDLDNYTSNNCLCPATATGGKCPAGSFCPEGSAEPILCPPGFFCATSGLSAPSGPCEAGYFCAEGAASPTPEDGLTGAPCPPGTFCPSASRRPTPCPIGTFSSLPEQTVPSACQACPRGFYCKEVGLQAPSGQCPAGYYCDSSARPIQDFSLYPCPQGYYCPLGTAVATQHSCPVGTYNPWKGLRSITECQLCPAGKFCALAGLEAPTGDCTAGHWCKGGATRKDPPGHLCPAGHYCLQGAVVPAPCPPGTWSEEGNRTPEGCRGCSGRQLCSATCSVVPTAAYPSAEALVLGLCFSSVSCAGGTVPATPTQGLSGRPCPLGHFCPLGLPDHPPCPPGSYTSSIHTTKCRICPSGHYCIPGLRPQLCPRDSGLACICGFYCPEGSGLTWQPCPPGTYGRAPGLSSLAGCRACDGGKFCPRANATEAGGQCWEGFFCSRGSTRPNPEAGTEEAAGPCPQGHYCPRGSAMPQPCPPGTFSARIKLGSEAACSRCLPGHYCSIPGLTSPSGLCSPGFFCLGGALAPNGSLGDRTGGPCPAGHFCPPGTVTPRPCPAGTHNSLAAQGHCEPCPEGFFCPANTSSTVGNECPAGHYCPASTSFASQFPCPRGTYKPQRGGVQQSDCNPCEPGSYCLLSGLAAVSGPCRPGFHCTRGSAVPNPTDGITGDLCPPGHFCPQGSPRPTPCPPGLRLGGLLAVATVCGPAGSFLPIPGATSLGDCQPCPAGWFCSQAGLSSPEAACEGGWFCPGASVSGHSPGTLCPIGYSCPQGSLEPQPCPPGQYQDEPGQTLCKTCPAGKFCPFGIQGPGARPIWPVDCPAGYYCPLGTQTPTQHPCPRGTFRERPGARSAEDCRPCPAGQFCSDSGAGQRFPDGPCAAGYYCPPGQTSATPTSFRCPRGFYCPEGSSQPRACESGTFQPQEAKGSCEPCPPGFYCEALGTGTKATSPSLCLQGYFCPLGSHSATAHPCPRGTFGPRWGAAAEQDCELCPAGMFCALEGLSWPSGLCHAAHYCAGGAVSPTPIKEKVEVTGLSGNDICPPGFFCPRGTGAPIPCRPGFYSSAPGLASEDQCQLCPPGYYCNSPGLYHTLEAELSDAGYICLGGSTIPSPCEPGTFSPLPGAHTCLPCPEGTYCPKTTTMEPTTCPRGHYCPAGTFSALPCPAGTLNPQEGAVCSTACQPCPAGRYCPGEGNGQPEGPCAAGHYCEGGAASPTPRRNSAFPMNGPCPLGHYCPKGALHPVPCPLGTMRSSPGGISQGSCEPCPAGFFCPSLGISFPTGACVAGSECPVDPKASSPAALPCPEVLLREMQEEAQSPMPSNYGPGLCSTPQRKTSVPPSLGSTLPPTPQPASCLPTLQSPRPEGRTTHQPSRAPGNPNHTQPGSQRCHFVFNAQGHFCQPGAAWPAPCHRGEYQPALGSDTCLPCPPGFHCPHPGSRVPKLCPAHAYCPAGTWSPQPCPPGTFTAQDTEGLREEGDCSVCPPGHYCRGGQVWGKCPAGYFCPPGTAGLPIPGPRDSQTLCPKGQLCAKKCSPGPNGNPCASGFYCPEGSGEPTLCPPDIMAATPRANQQEDCEPCPPGHWCKAGDPPTHPCPAGYYCPGGREAHPGVPQACPEHTYLAAEGGQSRAECRPCPAGYHCPFPGLSSFEGRLCPPGHWCPGGQGAFLCPPGTFRTEPGAALREDCELCPPGYYCPETELRGGANVFAIPCRAGFECPAGTVAEITCRPGSYCGPQTGVPPLCPGGYVCPAGSSTYTGPGQLCVFPYYCPPGSTRPRACPEGSEARNWSGLRVSEYTCCRLCDAGTYRSQALDALPCQPCPPGFSCQQGSEQYHSQPCPVGHYCPSGTHSPRPCPPGTFRNSSQAAVAEECLPCPAGTFSAQPGQYGCFPCGSSAFSPRGASDCTCRGLNRVFQKSDGSCICQAGHESYDQKGLESDESNSDKDCQPQVTERCSPGDVRLAATGKCVPPQQHDCSSFCHPVGGQLSTELGICRCLEYVSAEELCDAQCLARAPQLSLARGPRRELILSMKSKTGNSTQKELASTLGPDQFFHGSAPVHLVQCGPRGIFGFIISREDMLGSFLGPAASRPQLQRRHQTAGSEPRVSQDPSTHLQIPNPVICLVEGDMILFQLHILPHNRSASHYPVYQKQHLFNSNPHWDSGAFRRLGHLVRETHLNFSRFAHQFLDPGTYVFHDNGLPESMVVVLVKKKGVACSPGQAPVQPSSLYQLVRHGIRRRRLPNLGPNWTAITGVLVSVGLAVALLTGLGLVLRPSLAQACPVRAQRPQWRGLGETHMPAEYVSLGESPPFHEGQGPGGPGEGADSQERAITQSAGGLLPARTLEDFSIQTLYDKLEDQSLHMVAQLSKHRSDALAFYREASQQLWGLKDLLQGLSTTETGAKATPRPDTRQQKESRGHTTASPRERWQRPPGCTPSVSPLSFQLELDGVIAALASALSRALEPPAGFSRKASGPVGEQPHSTCQQDLQLANAVLQKLLSMPSDEGHQSASPQQDQEQGQLPQGDSKGGAESPHSRHGHGHQHTHGGIPELQRKIWQLEDTLDELNEEFFQLTAHALELQREEDKPDQPPLSKDSTFLVVPSIFPSGRQEDRPSPVEAGGPDAGHLGTRLLESNQALMLKVKRTHLAQRIEDVEWELSLLLQVADGTCVPGETLSHTGCCGGHL